MTAATTQGRQSDWVRSNALFFVVLLLGLGIFLAGRLAMLHSYGEPGVVSKYTDYLLNDLVYGSRLDLKILAIAIAPAYLLFLVIAMTVSFKMTTSHCQQI